VTRLAFLDPVGGLSGDMLLAALLDAGAPRAALDEVVSELALSDVRIDVHDVVPSGLVATHVEVYTAPGSGRAAADIRRVVERSRLRDRVRKRSIEALDRLAAAEATVHGGDPGTIVLHELGSDDTLVDICGAFALLDALDISRVVCAPLPMGRGIVDSDHGPLPVPAPATVELLRGVPVVGVSTPGELVTPTGAAIAVTASDAFGEMPAMTTQAIGTGLGSRTHADRPNVLRVLIGEEVAGDRTAFPEVVVLEANVDDLLPELVPDVIDACLAAGALDAWATPIQMKKGRPGVLLSVMGRSGDEARLADTLLRHSSSLGVRARRHARYELDRAIREVDVEGHTVRVKIGLLDGEVVNVAPEHDDCAAVAAATGRPVKQIWAEALVAANAIREGSDDLAH
jgi:pyridinium-3,5-bisthiocarboxylic acid mononucleotide nickel chelatase